MQAPHAIKRSGHKNSRGKEKNVVQVSLSLIVFVPVLVAYWPKAQ